MRLRLLGTAAGGGVPQWNCACPSCEYSRNTRTHRTQECALVSGNGDDWYLINASPDLRTQLIAAPEVTPGPERRQTPLRGVFLTDAELDHTLGLFSLREAESLDVYATPAVLSALEKAMPVKAMTNARWHAINIGETTAFPGFTAKAFPLGEKRPRYAEGAEGSNWVIGLRLNDVVYAPCFPEWTAELDEALEGARIAVLDGTFFEASEMPNVSGHLSIEDSRKHLKRFENTEFRYTHLNNTNPLLQDPQGLPLAGEMELL
jgi:pyrroloquinoline quinone biosynthesis protein B